MPARLRTLMGIAPENAAVMQGGASGINVVAGSSRSSLLIQAAPLPLADKKHMPSDGKPKLNADDPALLEWWIDRGAPEQAKLGEMQTTREIARILKSRTGLPDPAGEVIPLRNWVDLEPVVKNTLSRANILFRRFQKRSRVNWKRGVASVIRFVRHISRVQEVIPMRNFLLALGTILFTSVTGVGAAAEISREPTPDPLRARQVSDMKWGMFVCWSFSTFSEREWTPTLDKDASYFKATGCDTDQWCRTAKEAGMGYILFLTKHHDGFCLWDTATTDKKVTNSPLGVDVLAKLRASCDKHGIKLALYFSEGDWNWPGAVDGKGQGGGSHPEMKKAQLKELLTNYGPIEYIWFDHAVGDGGLSHEETDKWVTQLQPDCLPGYNHGKAAGRIRLGEMGRPSPLGDPSGAGFNRGHMKDYKGYIAAEFTYPILPRHSGPGAMWFYSVPALDNSCLPARKLYQDYVGAVKCGNIFSIDVGPDFAGKLRDIDVRTLQEVGKMIRDRADAGLSLRAKASASSAWSQPAYGAEQACDDDRSTRWGAAEKSRSGWLDMDLGEEKTVSHALVSEAGFDRVRKFELQVPADSGWKTILAGTTLGTDANLAFPAPVKARLFRLNILDATDVPTISEFQLFESGPR